MHSLQGRNRRIFLTSNYSDQDRIKIENMILALGGEVIELTDEFTATHLVAPYFKPTPKMVAAMAAGIWVVQTSYVVRSYTNGYWYLEEAYEIGTHLCPYSVLNNFDSIPFFCDREEAPRICREKALVRNRPNFANWKVGLIMENESDLLVAKSLLLAGGALVFVLKLPINFSDEYLKIIQFAIVNVKKMSKLEEIMKYLPCVHYNFIVDSLCRDPPPDVSKYLCHGNRQKERCTIGKMSNFGIKVLNSCGVKELTHSSYKKDNFGVVPIVVDFNLHGNRNAVVKRFNNCTSEVTSSEKCCDWWCENQCCSNTSVSPHHTDYHIDSTNQTFKQSAHNAGKKEYEAEVVPENIPSLKRPRSPDSMASSSKKKKIPSPQKNRIIRYLIQTDKACNGQPTITKVSRFKCENDSYSENYLSKIRSSKNKSSKRTACEAPSSPVTITISSDEENDSRNFVSNVKKNEISEKTISNLAKSLSAVNCHSEHLNDFNDKERSNCPTSSLDSSSEKQHFQTVYFISSDDDENSCPSLQENIIDLTCDDNCGFGDNAGDMFHEPTQEQKGVKDKEQSMHEESYSYGLVKGKMEIDKRKFKGQRGGYDKFHVPVHNKNETKSYIFSHDEFSLEKEICSEYGSQNILMENNSNSLYSPPSSYGTKYNVELWKSNGENILLEHDDINSPSPPMFGKISFHNEEEPLKHSDTVKKKKIMKTDKKPKEKSKVGKRKKKTSKDSGNNDSRVEIFSEIICNDDNPGLSGRVLQNNEKASNPQISERSVFEQCGSSSKLIYPSAGHVCKIHAQALMSKLCQPWKDLGSHYIPDCCVHDPDECKKYHEMRQDLPEEVNGNDDTFILRMSSPTSAVDFLQRRIDAGSYPTSTIVQYMILSAVDSWKDGVSSLLFCLHQLLREHPPCKNGMLEYYKKIFFTPVQKMDAPNGIFWWCMHKINDLIKSKKNIATNKLEDAEARENVNSVHASLSFSEKEVTELAFSTKLTELFNLLEFLIDVMEADLNVGLIKNMSNLKSYTTKSTRPLIAVALWNGHGIAGPVNVKCKELIEMYFIIFESYRNTIYFQYFKRLISLIAGVIYACDRNTSPPKYPNIGHHCKEFTNAFSSAMITSALNMVDVQIILKFLKPDWFRFCVCSNLVEKLYGRNMDISLQPVISLLKNLCAINQKFPSREDLSHTILGETESNSTVKNSCLELSPNFVKNATKKDKKGETRLHIACRRNNVSEVERLLRVPNINVNEKDNMGWTPLHEAALHGSTECVKLLLNFRTPAGGPAVDLRMRNAYGVTPLMDAVSRNHLEIAFQLLQHGGPEILLDKNDEDKSPFDLVNTEEMESILRNTSEECIYTDIVTIPRTLYIQLAVLSPLAILFYIQFSEVLKIASALEKGTKLKRYRESTVEFQAVMFKQDYLDVKKLQSLVEKISKCNSKLLKQFVFLM